MKFCLNCQLAICNRNKFCSVRCQKEYQYNEYINNWKNGNEDGLRGDYQLSMYIRTYLLKKYNLTSPIKAKISFGHAGRER